MSSLDDSNIEELLQKGMELAKKSPEEIRTEMINLLREQFGDKAEEAWESMKDIVLENLKALKEVSEIINSPEDEQKKKWMNLFNRCGSINPYQEMKDIRDSKHLNDFRVHDSKGVVVYDTSIYANEEDQQILTDMIREHENPAIAMDLWIARRSRKALLDHKITEREERELQKLADRELKKDTNELSRDKYLLIRKRKRDILNSIDYKTDKKKIEELAKHKKDSLFMRIQAFKTHIKEKYQCDFETLNEFAKPTRPKGYVVTNSCVICKNEMWQKIKRKKERITCNVFCRIFYYGLNRKEQEYLRSLI